ncbi:MAG: hypothetical protein LUC38_09815 [Oscillospiraceae bacterium]|nr:hypothetical protein [Oscillospiraceae bacterium]
MRKILSLFLALTLAVFTATLCFTACTTGAVVHKVYYNGNEYWICGAGDTGEGSVLEACGLPSELTADLCGDFIGFLKSAGNNAYEVVESETDIPVYNYAPQETENVYIVEIDGIYYAAIRHDGEIYYGLD